MPCYEPDPDPKVEELNKILEFVREINGEKYSHKHPGTFDDRRAFDGKLKAIADMTTSGLCEWCRENESKIQNYSLELQIWWRDHKTFDESRELKHG